MTRSSKRARATTGKPERPVYPNEHAVKATHPLRTNPKRVCVGLCYAFLWKEKTERSDHWACVTLRRAKTLP